MPPFRQSNGERSKLFPSGSRHGLQPELRSRQVRPQHGQIASVKHSKVSVAKLSRVRPSQGLAQQRQRDPDAGTAHQDSTDRACGRQRPAREQSKLLAQRGTSVPGSVWVVEVHQTSSNFIHNGAVINTSSQMMTSSLSTAVRRSWRSFLRDRRTGGAHAQHRRCAITKRRERRESWTGRNPPGANCSQAERILH